MNRTNITRFYTKEEVAQILQVSVRTINQYMNCGLPYTKIRGTVRIAENGLMEWLRKQERVVRKSEKKREDTRSS